MPSKHFNTHYGIDMTGREQAAHFRHLQNLYRRLDGEGEIFGAGRALETVAGFRRIVSIADKIHTLAATPDGKRLLIHAGKSLYLCNAFATPGIPKNEEEYYKRRLNILDPDALDLLQYALPLTLKGETADGKTSYLHSFLPERPIATAAIGRALYLADGVRLYKFDGLELTVVTDKANVTLPSDDGTSTVTLTSITPPYVPTVSKDGVEYEQRNLLTDLYYQTHTFRETDITDDGNAPLVFERIGYSSKNMPICRVVGMLDGDFGNTLVIPDTTEVGGVSCAVAEIAPNALSGAPYTTLVLPHSLHTLPSNVLVGCGNIKTVRIPIGMTELHYQAFNECAATLTIEYEGDEDDWKLIKVSTDNYTGTATLRYGGFTERWKAQGIRLALKTADVRVATVDNVIVGKSGNIRVYPLPAGDGFSHLLLLTKGNTSLVGKNLCLTCEATPFKYVGKNSEHPLACTKGDLFENGVVSEQPENHDETAEGKELLHGCRLMVTYDHRLFFGGMPALPDVLFYSHEDSEGNPTPTYIGIMNYMTDEDRMPIRAIDVAGGALLVSHADSTAYKLCAHTPKLPATADSLFIRLYPTEATYPVKRFSKTFVYNGILHVLTDDGLYAYERNSNGNDLIARRRSGRIAPALARADHDAVFFASLDGMLALFDGSRVFLGDSTTMTKHDGTPEYEWYPLENIGTYTGDEAIYRTVSELPPTLEGRYVRDIYGNYISITASSQDATLPASSVTSKIFYTLKDDGTYQPESLAYFIKDTYTLVDECGYFDGGDFSPACAAVTMGNRLFFGTAAGDLCVFNTDLTGEKKEHRDYYLFDGHRAPAGFSIFPDDCGTPTRHKRTKPASAYIFLRPMANSSPTLTVSADAHNTTLSLPAAPFDFETLSFETLGFIDEGCVRLPIPERDDFVMKSYALQSDMPFAFLGISYDYTII